MRPDTTHPSKIKECTAAWNSKHAILVFDSNSTYETVLASGRGFCSFTKNCTTIGSRQTHARNGLAGSRAAAQGKTFSVIRFVPTNAQHIGTRANQQDSFSFSDLNDQQFATHGGFVAVVADGMGGLAHGDAASRIAVKAFLETYATKTASEPVTAALERALRSANSAVYNLAVGVGAPGDVGTTLVAVAMQPGGLHWISVGDSAIYLFREGELTLLTTSHIYGRTLDAQVVRGEMSKEQALSDPQREALTSYVGAAELREIDRNIRPFPIQPGDCVLLASDGLFKTILDREIAATVAADGDRAPEVLVRKTLACKKEHQDNVTVCLVRVEDDNVSNALPPLGARRLCSPETITWEPAGTAEVNHGPPKAPPPSPLPARRRLPLFLFLTVLFAAVASLAGWFLVQKPLRTKGPQPRPDGEASERPRPLAEPAPAPPASKDQK